MSSSIIGPKNLPEHTYVAGGAVVKNRAVKRGADLNTVVQGTAGAVCLGISTDDQDTTGRTVPVAANPGDIVYGEAGAAFALDASLMSNASGQLVTATSGNSIVAYARQAATAATQLVAIEIAPRGQAVP